MFYCQKGFRPKSSTGEDVAIQWATEVASHLRKKLAQ